MNRIYLVRFAIVLSAFFCIAAATAGVTAWAAQSLSFDPAAATDAYLAGVSSDARLRSDAYFEGGYWLILWDFVSKTAVALILLSSGFAALARTRIENTIRRPFLGAMLLGCVFSLATWFLLLPYNAYRNFFRERAYGLMNLDLIHWLGENLIRLGLATIITGLFVGGIYSLITRAPRTWWVWGAGVSMAFIAVMMIAGPVFFAPLFNHYQPMREGDLKVSILSLAKSNMVPASDVYEFDASRQTDRISANVSGFLGTTRISLNDNLLNKATPAEVRAVMGHEMGHYVLNHSAKLLLEFGMLNIAAFAFLGWALPRAVSRFGPRWGLRGAGDAAGFPLLVILIAAAQFFLTPLTNSIIRTHEAEADAFGLNLAREPDGFASIALKLSPYRKLAPGPIEEFLLFDHPSGHSRIFRAMTWKAENMDTPRPGPAPDAASGAQVP